MFLDGSGCFLGASTGVQEKKVHDCYVSKDSDLLYQRKIVKNKPPSPTLNRYAGCDSDVKLLLVFALLHIFRMLVSGHDMSKTRACLCN